MLTADTSSALQIEWLDSIHAIDAEAWNALAGEHPFLQHAMLHAFESSGSVGDGTGWNALHLAAFQLDADSNKTLVGAIPLYLKQHSYGEYVFDWAWADAFERAGGQYYPKLISAIPFSPVTGPRILCASEEVGYALLDALTSFTDQQGLSSIHVLFPDQASANYCAEKQWLIREGVQFRWENQYSSWEAFLSQLSHDKRKKIKQERNKVSQQGVTCRVLNGQEASTEDWDFFYACYCNTYDLHHSQPYLTRAFFSAIAETMPQQIALFMAYQDNQPVAVSLCIHNQDTLYGRYWGAIADIKCLHFELCYYQPQMYCIEQGIRYFEGGAQGVHKLARGFLPYPTCSYHWIQQPNFKQAIAQFLQREQHMMHDYVDELNERSPFKSVAILPSD